jgi:DNA-binding transcriptional MerR regulator
VPTIKFYVREGLLPPGERTQPNQASYGDAHLRRLRLIRALIEVGGISLGTARLVIAHLDQPDASPVTTMGKAQYALSEGMPSGPPDEHDARAAELVTRLCQRRGWSVDDGNPARRMLTDTVAAFDRLGHGSISGSLDAYAAAAEDIARTDIEAVREKPTGDEIAEAVVIWTVLGDRLISALRRLAQESLATGRAGTA